MIKKKYSPLDDVQSKLEDDVKSGIEQAKAKKIQERGKSRRIRKRKDRRETNEEKMLKDGTYPYIRESKDEVTEYVLIEAPGLERRLNKSQLKELLREAADSRNFGLGCSDDAKEFILRYGDTNGYFLFSTTDHRENYHRVFLNSCDERNFGFIYVRSQSEKTSFLPLKIINYIAFFRRE